MTANQIIIPLALAGFVVFVLVLVLRGRRGRAKVDVGRTHRAHSPASQNDRGSVALSATSGHMGSDE